MYMLYFYFNSFHNTDSWHKNKFNILISNDSYC